MRRAASPCARPAGKRAALGLALAWAAAASAGAGVGPIAPQVASPDTLQGAASAGAPQVAPPDTLQGAASAEAPQVASPDTLQAAGPAGPPQVAPADAIALVAPRVVLAGVPFAVVARGAPPGAVLLAAAATWPGAGTDDPAETRFEAVAVPAGSVSLTLVDAAGATLAVAERHALPGWLSVLPPLVAFALAVALRQVVPALFVAVWLGGFLIAGPSLASVWHGLLDAAGVHVVAAATDPGHATLLVFTFMMGGLVAIVARNGGARGMVERVARWAGSPRRAGTATFGMGLAFFFDDYANTLVVGKTMRPIADAARLSREKLAFLVDSTAAPVATLALVSSWIGFQLGLIEDAIAATDGLDGSAYGLFLNSLAYNFYPLLMLVFVLASALTGRDFGPMARAERRARAGAPGALPTGFSAQGEDLGPKPGATPRAANAYLPLATLIVTMLASLHATGVAAVGREAGLAEIIGAADSHLSMLWATLVAVLAAAALSVGRRLLTLAETLDAWYAGCRSMLFAVIVLVLAWALAGVNAELGTAQYLTALLGAGLDARLVPAIVFVLAAAAAFATGTSWGVMGILMPIVIPLAWTTMRLQGLEGAEHLLYASVSAVLAGAVMGDHASPISDTTILSSLAASCDHIDHVRTQAPYALLVGAVAVALGSLPAAYGAPWWLCLGAGAVTVVLALRGFGRRPPVPGPGPAGGGTP